MKTRNFRSIASLLILTLFLAGCGAASDRNRESPDLIYDNIFEEDNTEAYDIATLIEREPEFSTFEDLVERSGISLEFDVPVTVLAPPNDAFEKLPDGYLDHLGNRDNKADLVRFINRHILSTERSLVEFRSEDIFETTLDEQIRVTTDMNGQIVYVGGAQIVKSDIPASDGIIHIVDEVVEPTDDVIPWP